MVSAPLVLAYFVPGVLEWILLLTIGLLLFGRRLPEVGRAAGRTLADLRRGFDQFKRELDRDESLTSARDSFRDAKQSFGDLRRTVSAPTRAVDPRRIFDDLTDDTRATDIRPAGVETQSAGEPTTDEPGGDLPASAGDASTASDVDPDPKPGS